MGLSCSTLEDLKENEYLSRFCSKEIIGPNDPIWNNLFSHSLRPIFRGEDFFMLDSLIEKQRDQLILNSPQSKNVASLVKVFLLRANELRSSVQTCDNMFIWQTYNALFIIRNVSKYFVESMNDEQFIKQFESTSDDKLYNNIVESDHQGIFELLINTLVKIIIEVPVKNNTYLLHLEAINTIITLLSMQMYWCVPSDNLTIFRTIMKSENPGQPSLLLKALLKNFIIEKNPPDYFWQDDERGSIVIGVASGIWNILRQGVGLGKANSLEGIKEHTLSSQSLYLLLVLISHCTSTGKNGFTNPYRNSIITFENEPAQENNEGRVETVDLFYLNYSQLYASLCDPIVTDETTLLLYTLIHRNNSFKSYIMARSDIENLVLPILKTLYNAPSSTSHHIYMSLIVLLILSEDELFNQQVHDIPIKNISWYQERNVSEITLGGLIILVVIRTIQYNITKMRDKYLHTNCLAALANMSSKFRCLHPYVAQRLLSLFETLAKRHTKLLELFKNICDQEVTQRSQVIDEKKCEIEQDINVLEEVIRMVLEILNSTLTHQLPQNKHLVYTLLYNKHIFDSLRNYEATQDLVFNLDLIINYFSKRLDLEQSSLGVSGVMQKIEEGVLHWKPDILRKFQDLKFRYVEEESPEDFFVPYIWSIIFKKSGLYWSSVNISLFNLQADFSS